MQELLSPFKFSDELFELRQMQLLMDHQLVEQENQIELLKVVIPQPIGELIFIWST